MIRILTVDYQTQPIAIEQPLDLSVPESKTILAIYLSMPEVENDRRACVDESQGNGAEV